MNNLDLTLEIDRKKEYTNQVVSLLNIRIYEGIQKIYIEAKNLCKKRRSRKYLKQFQNLISNIPKWSKSQIESEFNRIKEKSKCSWLEELITAVFVSHTKVLIAVKGNSKFNLEVPNGKKFLHTCYIECARFFWKNPYLFSDVDISPCEYQRNLRDCEQIISKIIVETIRKMLPVETILKEYLGNGYTKNDQNESINISNIVDIERENVKKLVTKDLNTMKLKNNTLDESFSMFIEKNNIKVNKSDDVNIQTFQEIPMDGVSTQQVNLENKTLETLDETNQQEELNDEETVEYMVLEKPNETEDKQSEQSESKQQNVEETSVEVKTLTEEEALEMEPSQQQETHLDANVETLPSEEVLESRNKSTVQNIDNFLDSIQTSKRETSSRQNKINNLDILSENTVSGSRIKNKKETLSILKDSESHRRKKKYSRFLFS